MKINYWDCKYESYDEYWNGEEETRVYGCTHPDNKDSYCRLDNKYAGAREACSLLSEKPND